jgi:uncharacterized protein (DUF488 family)
MKLLRLLARRGGQTRARMHPLFTIGHSNLEMQAFVSLLTKNKVRVVADVRSRPRSFHHPQFTQPEFEAALRELGLRYIFLGEELGGRPADPMYYRRDGLVDYRARRKAHDFEGGIVRVAQELERESLALLCAEEDPITCHRFLLIGPALLEAGVEPRHIRKDGSLESQRDAEDRLLRENHYGDVSSDALFAADRAAALEDAYVLQEGRCAFRADAKTVDLW